MDKLLRVYAVKHKDPNVRAASRSGGIFTAISDKILSEGGSVFGCILSDDFLAYHVKATTYEQRDKMRGSKYIQSNMGDVFRDVKVELDSGRLVLFTGTSCQVDGLKSFLGKDYVNLLCIDIVCHGVPSPKVWLEYLKWQEKKNKKRIVSVNFRNKTDFGWAAHKETLYTSDGSSISSEVFKELFYKHNILRPSCYECKYKHIYHPGDITIADYWGIDKACPGFNDNKGVSLVLINSEKGEEYFDDVSGSLEYSMTDINNSLQPALQKPFPCPITRDQFWKDLKVKDFDYIAKEYGGLLTPFQEFVLKWKNRAKKVLKLIIGKGASK